MNSMIGDPAGYDNYGQEEYDYERAQFAEMEMEYMFFAADNSGRPDQQPKTPQNPQQGRPENRQWS